MGNKKTKVEFDAAAELTEDEIDLLAKSTGFERNMIVDFHKNYIKLYPNGMINNQQFERLYKELFPFKQLDSNGISAIFTAFDDNCSGEICFAEFLTAISITGKADPDEKLHLAFKMYDSDRSGFLELGEICQINIGLRGIIGADSDSESLDLEKWDSNGNGGLTEEEFIKFVKSNPKVYKHFLDVIKMHD